MQTVPGCDEGSAESSQGIHRWNPGEIQEAGKGHHVRSDPRRQVVASKETQKQGLRAITSRAGKNAKNPMGVFQTMPISFGHFPSENPPTFPAQEPGKIP